MKQEPTNNKERSESSRSQGEELPLFFRHANIQFEIYVLYDLCIIQYYTNEKTHCCKKKTFNSEMLETQP